MTDIAQENKHSERKIFKNTQESPGVRQSSQNPVVPTPSNTPLASKPVSASTSFGRLLLGLLFPPDEVFDCTGTGTCT